MIFENKSLVVDNCPVELVHCCDLHGKVPKWELEQRHPKPPPTKQQKHNLRRRENRKYVCLTCKTVFTGSGSYKPAERHWKDSKELGSEHVIIQGKPEGKHRVAYGGAVAS